MGLFNHHQKAEIIIDGHEVSVEELVDRYNQLGREREEANQRIDQLQDHVEYLQKQLAAQLNSADQPKADLHELQQDVTTLTNRLQEQLSTNKQLLQEQDNLRQQLDNRSVTASTTLIVDGQKMTAADVQATIVQWQNAANQAKTRLQKLLTKNAELAKAAQAAQSITMGGQPITVDELIDRYNDLLKELRQSHQQVEQLQRQLKGQSTSLSIDGQTFMADDIQKLLKQHQDTANQLRKLRAKNAELTKTVQATQSLTLGGKPITIDKVIKNYNKLLKQLQQTRQQVQQLQEQHDHQPMVTFNGRTLTVDNIQELLKKGQDAANRLEKTTSQLKTVEQDLAAAKQVTINGEAMSVAELVKRYYRLLRQYRYHPRIQSRSAPQMQNTQLTTVSPASQKKLVNRYYRDVQAVLSKYQDQVAKLQHRLTNCLKDNGQVEFLQLVKSTVSPSSYQKMFLERNQQMIRYIENHQHQEELVRRDDQERNPHDELRGVRYWGNFVFRYRKTLTSLLEQNRNVHRNFKYAYHYAKTTAKRIGESKPSYLSDQNVKDLRMIHSGIKDEQVWTNDMKEFRRQVHNTLKGVMGERLVRNVVATYNCNRVLTSLNLPYQYENGKNNSNQIDCIVVNQKGIFILEIKNYTADAIGIDQDGFIVTERGGNSYRSKKITRQGQLHYKAVLKSLEADEMTKPYINYLKHQIHVLYVSTNPRTEIKPAYPNANLHYHFIGLDGLRKYIDSTKGQLRPEVIRSVVEAIDNRQQAEKRYDYFCFPSDPDKRAEAGWQQYTVMRQLLKLKLDDFVDQSDPDIRKELDMVGLQTCDGYVTSKPHSSTGK